MALAVAKAARLKPNIRLAQVLKEYEASLTGEQKDEYLQTGPPSANAVITLTCDIDRRNEKRKTRRYGARLTTFLNSVKGFTAIVDVVVGSVGNPIAGAVWGAVKIAMQVSLRLVSWIVPIEPTANRRCFLFVIFLSHLSCEV